MEEGVEDGFGYGGAAGGGGYGGGGGFCFLGLCFVFVKRRFVKSNNRLIGVLFPFHSVHLVELLI